MKVAAILSLVLSSLVLAATNNCPNTTSASSVNNGSASASVTIPGAVPGNDFTSLGSIGCTAVDFNFSNFTGTFTGTPVNGALSLGGTYLAEIPAGTAGNPFTNPDTLIIASVRGAANVGTNGDNNDGLNNFVANNNNVVTDDFAFHVGASATDPGNTINAVILTALQAALGNGASGSITVDVCSGSQTGVITTAGACTGSFFTQTLNLATLASQSTTLTLPNLANFNITTVVTLTGGNGNGNNAGFDAFSLAFGEQAPEPSTLIAGATGLLLLLVLHFRRRRRDQPSAS